MKTTRAVFGFRRAACIVPVACALSCSPGATLPARPADTTAFQATVTLDLDAPSRPAPAQVAGSNVQWVDGGDNLIADYARGGVASASAGTGPEAAAGVRAGSSLAAYAPRLLRAIDSVAPTALRFPGGTNADTYHWREGAGPLAKRGLGEHVFRKQPQRMVFGTDEFLALTDRLHATPVITVNVPTGTASEAAEWVKYVNAPNGSQSAPRVRYWEIGNEPYLREESRPELALQPAAFAARVSEFIRAMKAVDPRIAVGVPLRLDKLGTLPLVHFPGYAETVLRDVQGPIDFLALHDAYLPLLYKGGAGGTDPSADALFAALMSSSRVVEEDLRNVRTLWNRLRPSAPLAMAVTEYSSMFTLGGAHDTYVSSVGGALYLADVMRVFATTPDVILANQWSLNGNGIFGALSTDGELRPAAHVLRLYSQVLKGRLVQNVVQAPTFESPAMGAVPSYRDTPLVSVLATLDSTTRGAGGAAQSRIQLVVLNKSFSRPARFVVQTPNSAGPHTLTLTRSEALAAPAGKSVFDAAASAAWAPISPVPANDGLPTLLLPPQSVSHITLEVSARR